MSKCATLGEYMAKRLKTEKILRCILIAMLLGLAALIVLAVVKSIDFLVAAIFLFFVAVIYTIIYVDKYACMLGNRKWLKKLGYEHIADDMLIDNPIMPESKIYCGEKAIFSEKFGLVIPYTEIAWVYMYRRSVNGFNVDNHLNLHTKSGKKILVYAKKNEFKILMLCIASKVPGVIAGYGNEQKLKYKALLKENDKK